MTGSTRTKDAAPRRTPWIRRFLGPWILGVWAVLAPAGSAPGAEASEPADIELPEPSDPAPASPGTMPAGPASPDGAPPGPTPLATGAAPGESLSTSTRLIPIPFVYYSPETRFAGGAAAIVLFGPRIGASESDPRSSVGVVGIHTQNRQSLASVSTGLYMDGGRLELEGMASYSSFPTSFFGLGNDTRPRNEEEYTPEELTLSAEAIRDVGRGFRLGARLATDRLRLSRIEPAGRFAAGGVPGADGGWTSEATAIARFDTRDRRNAPSRGVYLQTEAGIAGRALGSGHAFRSNLADARAYVPVFGGQVVAVRGLARFSGGTVPFHRMPSLGGGNLLRGYYEGRFRDRQLAAFQVEDRIPVKGRFGAALFVGAGQVAGTLSGFGADRFHLAWGWGVRVALSRKDALTLRLDSGTGSDQSGTYFSIGEAY